jgi:aspartate/methionine/tyrosine aminotransferase
MIHMEVGEPDFATPERIVAAGVWGMQNGRTTYTSASGTAEMRGAIANYVERTRGTAVSPANILIAPGVKAALYYTLIALVDPGDEVLMPDPGFPGYQEITRIAGGIPVMFPLRPEIVFQPDVAEIESLITARTKCIVLNSQGNPSGTINGRSHLEAIAQLAQQHDLWIVSDEIYAQLYYGARESAARWSRPGRNGRCPGSRRSRAKDTDPGSLA